MKIIRNHEVCSKNFIVECYLPSTTPQIKLDGLEVESLDESQFTSVIFETGNSSHNTVEIYAHPSARCPSNMHFIRET